MNPALYRVTHQATILELLEGVGFNSLAANMILAEDSHKPLGAVLADAVKAGWTMFLRPVFCHHALSLFFCDQTHHLVWM